MDTKKHNGWSNYDTWKVIVYLDNTRSNYDKVKAVKKILLKAKKKPLINWLRKYLNFSGDTINWSNVSSTDLKKAIRDVY